MNLLSSLKTHSTAILAALVGILSALVYGFRQKALREEEKRKGVEKARETETKATKAIVEGQSREKTIRETPVDTSRRDHFQ